MLEEVNNGNRFENVEWMLDEKNINHLTAHIAMLKAAIPESFKKICGFY
jgi:hypothetical protein